MKTTIFFLVVSFSAWAGKSALTREQLIPRFEVKAEIFTFDGSGTRLLSKKSEWRTWRTRDEKGKIESHFSSESEDGLIALHHVWDLQDDGSVRVHIEQYGKLEPGGASPKFVDLVRKEDLTLENFSPITWVAKSSPEKRVVVRLTPDLREDETAKPIGELPLSGSDLVVMDGTGAVWARNADVEAKYAGLITHRGAIFLSFYPFSGAKAFGVASENKIELKTSAGTSLTIYSSSSFLPRGVHAQVYGIQLEELKTERLGSVQTITSSKEENFLKRISELKADPRFRR